MSLDYLEVLVEEPSAEQALTLLLPRVVPGIEFSIRSYQGRPDLLRRLPQRLRGYGTLAKAARIGVVVLIDRDDDDCHALKSSLEKVAAEAGMRTLSTADVDAPALVANRIACEELEAWFLGDVPAMVAAFPGVPTSLAARSRFRDPDAVSGGTWQAFEKVLREHGHHPTGLRKIEAARAVAVHMDVEVNRSTSFAMFRDGVRRLVGGEH